ncbi:potassium channel family protein [Alkalibacillus aidingensis]|uniref:potassium channel family protein n=1 Tax=Alkalibacillus aidingensis TaxID=2747607 RepID=UPI001CB6FF65|nr:potassium channel family protein [Alkalibacillus aidingensis]
MRNLTLILYTVIFVVFCTIVAYLLESDNLESLWNSFYFVMTTFSTVGYGDYSPVTFAGKLFAVFMYLVGIGLLGVVIGKIVDAFSIFKRKREEGKVNYMKKSHIIIVGWNKKTEAAIQEILSTNPTIEVVLIDTLNKSPIDMTQERVHYVQGDVTAEETFEKANISEAKSVIIFSDESIQDPSLRDAKTLTIAIVVERLAPSVHTTVEVLTEEHTSNFSHVKVDEFILSQETVSRIAVRAAMYEGVSKVYSQLISRQYGEDLYKISKKDQWITYQDAFNDLLDNGATLIADGAKLDINRRLNEKIPSDAELYVICNEETYQKIS